MSPLSPESRRKLNPRQGKTLSTSNICQVCGDSASIYNYGALSCQSCKTFFRRNASHPYVRNLFLIQLDFLFIFLNKYKIINIINTLFPLGCFLMLF